MRWVFLVAISLASVARAHDADVIYALVEQHTAAPTLLLERLTLTPASLLLLAPVDVDGDTDVTQQELDARAGAIRAGVWDDMPLSAGGQRCRFVSGAARVREGFVELLAEFDCPAGELRQDFRVLRVLPANYRVVLGSQVDGERAARGTAQGSFTTLPVPRPLPPGAWDGAAFSRGFDAGLARGFRLDGLAALAAVLLAIAAWRRGLLAAGLLLTGLMAASFLSVDALVCTVVAVFAAAVAVVWPRGALVAAAVLGAALGARDGGGGVSTSVGLAVGSVVLLGPAAVALSAVSVMVARRPPARRVAPALALIVAVVAGAWSRLS